MNTSNSKETPLDMGMSMNATEMVLAADLIVSALREIQPAYRSKAIARLKRAQAPIEGDDLPESTKALLAIIVEALGDKSYIPRLMATIEEWIDQNERGIASNEANFHSVSS